MLNWLGLARLALSNLRINKLRSVLTVLGMTFGTGAVIATLSSNEGAAQYIRAELEKLGTGNLVARSLDSAYTFTENDLELVKAYAPGFTSRILLSTYSQAHVRHHTHVTPVTLQGITSEFFAASKLGLATGRVFDGVESRQGAPVAVLGAQVKKALFQDHNPINQYVHLFVGEAVLPVQVVGILPEKGGPAAAIDASIFLPSRLLQKIAPAEKVHTSLVTGLANEEKGTEGKLQLLTLLKNRFPRGLEVADAREAIERTKNIWGKQNLVGICLAFISLITGGVGIMNIMLLSVAQRRKEIGLRKAVGAAERDILAQFLLEAVIVCFLGGLLGILFGVLFGQRVAQMMGQWKAVISIWTVLSALGFSMLTGIVFGLLPALRASRMDPYEALRG